MDKEMNAYISKKKELIDNIDKDVEIFKNYLIRQMEQKLSKGWYCERSDKFVVDEEREVLENVSESSSQRNPADEWWEKKMKLPIGKTGLFKCHTCRFAYASQNALNKHTLKCKKPKTWKQEWISDSLENRKEWRRSA
jgi:hypothetical protein